MNDRPVRVRIAPSPTGDPHVGTAYVGLMNMAFARKNGGKFILRIEDTDQERSTKASEQAIFDALKWVGLTWDEGPDVGGEYGPYRQSERTEIYQKHVRDLVENGSAYPCFCDSEALAAIRERQRQAKQNKGYDGTCRSIPKDEALARMKAGEPHVIRLLVPDGTTTVHDELRGDVVIDHCQIDDQILLKSDGYPTYHLANVVDDHLMEITHVIRAEEWINSTPKHILLYQAFGWEPPKWVHLPLLRNHDKSKISKRKNPVNLLYYQQIGVMPEAMLNFLAMLGHSMPDEREVFDLLEFIEEFSFKRISLGGPVFDVEKLMWLNGVRIRDMQPAELAARIRDTMMPMDWLLQVVPLFQERMRVLGEFMPQAAFFRQPELNVPANDLLSAIKGDKDPKVMAKWLLDMAERLDAIRDFNPQEIEAAIRGWCEESGVPTGTLFMLLRISLTGRRATPPLFDTLAVLGRAACSQRLRAASTTLKSAPAPK
jgi:glutamyl-tRNA synthetase